MSESALTPRVRVDRHLDDADRRLGLHDGTFWSLRETPRGLSPVWLYDERGSQLFDEITQLPEYYLARAETTILMARAPEIATLTRAETLVELGSGTSRKTRLLLDALDEIGSLRRFAPVDVSEKTLLASAHAIANEYAGIGVHAVVGDFERHLDALPGGDRRLLAFLGSTVGNLDPDRRRRFLEAVAAALEDDDTLLLGVDLVKDPARLEAAYNDGAGLTERFLRNGLEAVNRELGGDFRQDRFAYEALWDERHEWVDIGFRARAAHVVSLAGLGVEIPFADGESLRMEVSAKFRRGGIGAELAGAGLELDRWWSDPAGDFALLLARPAR
jgi:L-histidine N-alpha-methyltransferase